MITNNRTLSIPGDVRFNTCIPAGPTNPTRRDAGFDNYALLIHESGHALGISDYWDNFPFLSSTAHSLVPQSVMGYDETTGFPEPDCSPHPLDIMAIYALYQTIRP